MRLIDADAVIKKQRETMESLYVKTIPELKEHMGIDDALSVYIHCMEGYARAKQFYHGLRGILENAPTVDAVQVTRCRNCEYYKNHPNGLCYLHTEPKENERGYSGEAFCVEPDDFCSYGKPKEDNKCDMVWM
nr:MAG TPA: hypothetical protein [Caudoviricetes sp.]